MNALHKRTRPAGTGRRFGKAHSTQATLYGNGSHLRLPPFGRDVEAALAADKHPNVRLYACTDGWQLATQRRYAFGRGSTLLLPPGDDPEAYRWPPVRELVAIVTGLPGDTLHALARALVRDGLQLGYLLDSEHFERSLRVIAKRGAP